MSKTKKKKTIAVPDPAKAQPVVEAPIVTKTKAKKPAAPAPKKAVVGIAGVKTYRAGSANAAVFALLSDGKVHTAEECYKAALATGTKYKADGLWYVATDGKKTGGWEVLKSKSVVTFQMVLKKGEAS